MPLGGNVSKIPTYCVLWHEGISGRKDKDVSSTYLKVLQAVRDVKNVVFWTDNCSGQNKCWVLYHALVYAVNSTENNLQSITIKYLEKGHSFSAADVLHAAVEKKLKIKDVEDFDDAVNLVKSSMKGVEVLQMNEKNFFELSKGVVASSANKPLLRGVKVVRFTRGSSTMEWSKNRIGRHEEM